MSKSRANNCSYLKNSCRSNFEFKPCVYFHQNQYLLVFVTDNVFIETERTKPENE